MFNSTFNSIVAISLVDGGKWTTWKTLSRITDNCYHMKLYQIHIATFL